jgi:predicted ATPase
MAVLVDALAQRGRPGTAGGQEPLATAVAQIKRAVPDTVRQMIEQQVAGLPDGDRRALEAASVAGREFSAAAVAAGLADSLAVAEECCAGLPRQGRFLRASGVEEWQDGTVAGRFRFRHGLYQQVVYEWMSDGSRIRLHRRIGRRLEQACGAKAGQRAAELAGHFERGHDHLRAVR